MIWLFFLSGCKYNCLKNMVGLDYLTMLLFRQLCLLLLQKWCGNKKNSCKKTWASFLNFHSQPCYWSQINICSSVNKKKGCGDALDSISLDVYAYGTTKAHIKRRKDDDDNNKPNYHPDIMSIECHMGHADNDVVNNFSLISAKVFNENNDISDYYTCSL